MIDYANSLSRRISGVIGRRIEDRPKTARY